MKVITDKLASYSAAKKELIPSVEPPLFNMKITDVSYHINLHGNKQADA